MRWSRTIVAMMPALVMAFIPHHHTTIRCMWPRPKASLPSRPPFVFPSVRTHLEQSGISTSRRVGWGRLSPPHQLAHYRHRRWSDITMIDTIVELMLALVMVFIPHHHTTIRCMWPRPKALLSSRSPFVFERVRTHLDQSGISTTRGTRTGSFGQSHPHMVRTSEPRGEV